MLCSSQLPDNMSVGQKKTCPLVYSSVKWLWAAMMHCNSLPSECPASLRQPHCVRVLGGPCGPAHAGRHRETSLESSSWWPDINYCCSWCPQMMGEPQRFGEFLCLLLCNILVREKGVNYISFFFFWSVKIKACIYIFVLVNKKKWTNNVTITKGKDVQNGKYIPKWTNRNVFLRSTPGLPCTVTPVSPSPLCDLLSPPWTKLCLQWSSLGQLRAESGPRLQGERSRAAQLPFGTLSACLCCKNEQEEAGGWQT